VLIADLGRTYLSEEVADALYLPKTPGAPVDFNNQILTNVADPAASHDVATKGYVDTAGANITAGTGLLKSGNVLSLNPFGPGDNSTGFKTTTDAFGRVKTLAGLASGDVTGALGYTPVNKAGDVMGGGLLVGGTLTFGKTRSNVTSATGTTFTAAQLLGGLIFRSGPAVAVNDTIDSAANIIAAITGAKVGTTFEVDIVNTTTQRITLVTGVGITIDADGIQFLQPKTMTRVLGVVTNLGSPAVTIYGLSAGVNYPVANINGQFITANGGLSLNGSTVWTQATLTNVTQLANNAGYVSAVDTIQDGGTPGANVIGVSLVKSGGTIQLHFQTQTVG
jgi:hypothetical protein